MNKMMVDQLVALIELGLKEKNDRRPVLAVVGGEWRSEPEDPVTRQCRISRIRWMAKAFSLKWLVEQHCFGKTGIEDLDRTDLEALHKDMEYAYSCSRDGISFEDAGLIRSNYQEAV